MKHFFLIFFTVLGFSFISEAQELTPETVKRRLERSNNRIENANHREKAKTWVDRGIVFQDVYDVNTQYLYLGMSRDELRLFMGDPREVRTEESQQRVRNIYVYDNIELYFENEELIGWQETEVIHENPLDEAYTSFQKAIELEETGPEPGFFARIFSSSQDRRISNSLLRLHGQYVSKAVLEYEKNDFESSFQAFQRSIEIADSPYYEEPVDTGLVFNTGFVAALAGKYEESLNYLNRAKDMGYSEGGSLYVLMKEAYVELGDSTSAEQILQEGFKKFPQDNTILVELVNFYITSDNAQQALNYLNLAKQQEPDNPSFHYAEGALYEQMGEPEKAEAAYRRSLELDPNFFEANYNMGIVHFNRAVRMLEEANEIMDNKKYEEARDAAYDVLKLAIPYLEQAHAITPDDPSTMETLRIIYYRLGIEDKLEEMNVKLGREVLE
jgi:tetratricopeptide (TPR) repeat protein